ncbi:hypothetical protein Pmani_019476 [Petrolisthes manimaculis]|uniref:Uncharacterized protein n=1 Tax=Petrolisthes manimaculis TaxID=1843537 RepID=A0AAE1PI87_9EUCA|nr:hypothetical protein Pmani_019476 [Petrolisthes manimaculis]
MDGPSSRSTPHTPPRHQGPSSSAPYPFPLPLPPTHPSPSSSPTPPLTHLSSSSSLPRTQAPFAPPSPHPSPPSHKPPPSRPLQLPSPPPTTPKPHDVNGSGGRHKQDGRLWRRKGEHRYRDPHW